MKKPVQKNATMNMTKMGLNFYGDPNPNAQTLPAQKGTNFLNVTQNNFNIKFDIQRKPEQPQPHAQRVQKGRVTQQNFFDQSKQGGDRMYNSVMQDPHPHKSDYSMDLVLNASKV